MTQFNIGPEDGVKPVAWIRAHPDGTLSYELLRDDQIEQIRKDSGAWRALYTAEQIDRFAALVREQYREQLLGVGVEPIAFVSLAAWQTGKYWASDCFGEVKDDDDCAVYTADQLAAAVLRAKEVK